ncbi:MAG TPA: type II secretion system protein GspK [Candidatus Omnitrophota bacterium]|nr:type II secretion system protein GspK [Candidatus Omnitrophota bacterium]HRZ14469.1 type II secretion system protein GspK [Candidatus Omnitrophota bacterium]
MTKKASILLIALWTLATLSAFAVILSNQVRQKLELVRSLEARNKLHYIAEAGVLQAKAEIVKLKDKPALALKDEWSVNDMLFKNRAVGEGIVSIVYETVDEQAQRVERYGLIDEERKININKASREVLERLFRAALGADDTEAQNLAAAIIDWRDSDSELTVPLGSAEDPYYRTSSSSYEAKDAPFEIVEELLLVKGFSQNIFDKLKDYITIYGSGKVNLNTASRPVLLAVGLDTTLTDQLEQIRGGKDGIEATADDFVFENAADLSSQMSQVFSLSPAQLTLLNNVAAQSLVAVSKHFRVHSVARLHKGRGSREISCIINVKGEILSYQEL